MTDRDVRVADAQELLRQIGFDEERCNERSALVLLALLELRPEEPWSAASNPMRGTTEIMDWLRTHYGKDYKPNTRETVRRRTLHQFAEAGLVVLNPDKPTRPTNSPKSCYQIEPGCARPDTDQPGRAVRGGAAALCGCPPRAGREVRP